MATEIESFPLESREGRESGKRTDRFSTTRQQRTLDKTQHINISLCIERRLASVPWLAPSMLTKKNKNTTYTYISLCNTYKNTHTHTHIHLQHTRNLCYSHSPSARIPWPSSARRGCPCSPPAPSEGEARAAGCTSGRRGPRGNAPPASTYIPRERKKRMYSHDLCIGPQILLMYLHSAKTGILRVVVALL